MDLWCLGYAGYNYFQGTEDIDWDEIIARRTKKKNGKENNKVESLKVKLRVPNFYNSFHCIADRCKDSCCIGWEIDIDEDTYDYYQQVDGEFGKRLRNICVHRGCRS